jgi:hypothetical protein
MNDNKCLNTHHGKLSGGAFTGSGAKGIPQRITMTYALV